MIVPMQLRLPNTTSRSMNTTKSEPAFREWATSLNAGKRKSLSCVARFHFELMSIGIMTYIAGVFL